MIFHLFSCPQLCAPHGAPLPTACRLAVPQIARQSGSTAAAGWGSSAAAAGGSEEPARLGGGGRIAPAFPEKQQGSGGTGGHSRGRITTEGFVGAGGGGAAAGGGESGGGGSWPDVAGALISGSDDRSPWNAVPPPPQTHPNPAPPPPPVPPGIILPPPDTPEAAGTPWTAPSGDGGGIEEATPTAPGKNCYCKKTLGILINNCMYSFINAK